MSPRPPEPVPIPPLAAVAHELRTPLHGILGCAALLAGTTLDAEQRAHLAALTEAAHAALAFADDALDLARLGASPAGARPDDPTGAVPGGVPVPVRAVACDPRPVLAGVVRTLAPLAAARGLALDWSADAGAPVLALADPARVRQVLLNLAGNAVRATRRGQVRLQLRRDVGGGVAVDVVDTGPGLSETQRARLFHAWATGGASGGAGLGLVLARALAERMGGTLDVASTHGAGSTFTLRLPCATTPVTPPRRAHDGTPARRRRRYSPATPSARTPP